MKLSLNLNSYENPRLKRVLPFVRELGIGAAELWGCCLEGGEDVHKYSYNCKDIKGAMNMLDKYGIAVSVLTFGFGLESPLTRNPAHFASEFCKVIRLARSIGAPCVIHHMCGITALPEPQIELLRQYWEKPIECAEENGIVLALENETSDASYCPENVRALLDAFSSPCFASNFDIGNFHFGGSEPYPYGYGLLRGRIGNVHLKGYRVYDPATCPHRDMICSFTPNRICDSPRMYRCGAEYSGCNAYGFLSALQKDGYDGYISLEHHGLDSSMNEMFANTISWLSDCRFI